MVMYECCDSLTVRSSSDLLIQGDLAQDIRNIAQQLTDHLDPTAFPPGFPYPTCKQSPCALPVADARAAASLAAGWTTVASTYDEAQLLVASLPVDRQRFFASHTLTQLAIWRHTAVAMANISEAVNAAARGDLGQTATLAQGAVEQIEALLAAERKGEGGVFLAWHLYDWLDGYSSLRDVLRQTQAAAAAAAESSVGQLDVLAVDAAAVQARPFRFGTGSWNSFFQYETVPRHAHGDRNFPFFYAHPDEPMWSSFATAVRFRCAGCCENTVIGGNFNCTENATVSLAAIGNLQPGQSIRYTFGEGSAVEPPSNSSHGSEYDHTVAITLRSPICRPCSIAARVFDAHGKPIDPVTRATYNYSAF